MGLEKWALRVDAVVVAVAGGKSDLLHVYVHERVPRCTDPYRRGGKWKEVEALSDDRAEYL